MKFALKEWNTTIEALGNGQVIAIWRKGGIEDTPNIKASNEAFNIENKQFIFYPTYTHQNIEKIKPEFDSFLNEKPVINKDNQVKIKYWAEVEEEITPRSIDELISISSELVNNDEHLVASWNLYPNHSGKIILLRVYQLSDPILITHSPKYTGCKSWIELNIDIPKVGSKPVLSFKEFNKKVRLIKTLLENSYQLPEKEISEASQIQEVKK